MASSLCQRQAELRIPAEVRDEADKRSLWLHSSETADVHLWFAKTGKLCHKYQETESCISD